MLQGHLQRRKWDLVVTLLIPILTTVGFSFPSAPKLPSMSGAMRSRSRSVAYGGKNMEDKKKEKKGKTELIHHQQLKQKMEKKKWNNLVKSSCLFSINLFKATVMVRSNFNPLANFTPSVKVDSTGKATIHVNIPDNLTRYRFQ